MSTAQRVVLLAAILGIGAATFYFAYWQTRDTITPTDVQQLQAQSGLVAS